MNSDRVFMLIGMPTNLLDDQRFLIKTNANEKHF